MNTIKICSNRLQPLQRGADARLVSGSILNPVTARTMMKFFVNQKALSRAERIKAILATQNSSLSAGSLSRP